MVFTTLVPSPWSEHFPVVREYQQIYLAATGKTTYSYLGLEVCINAKVLTKGLRRAGSEVTPESLTKALESLPELRFGPMGIAYGASDHEGSTYVGLTIIDRRGHFVE